MKKILIIRFSSIGDIVLTTPILRCLKGQAVCELHYLTKSHYKDILSCNPHIDKIFIIKKYLKSVIKDLKKENYDYIIDLHNNLRSSWVKMQLRGVSSFSLKKDNFKKALLLYFGINILRKHVVDRYFLTVKDLNIVNDNGSLDYFLPFGLNLDFNVNQKFIAWCIGGSYEQKKLSSDQIISVCNQIPTTVLLLGGSNEKSLGDMVVHTTTNGKVYNFCGTFSINESAYLIQKSVLVLTNDTGMMHIASAFRKKIISFWGCTKPSLGFYPYKANNQSIAVIHEPHSRPCSKHGKYCRKTRKGCVKSIKPGIILELIKNRL